MVKTAGAKLAYLSVGLCILVSLLACQAEEPVRIGDITANAPRYVGKQVILNGEYGAWEAGHGTPPVTRSDWILKDATGAIYVTGKAPSGLDPAKDKGAKVSVYGVVRTKDNRAYIEAETVK